MLLLRHSILPLSLSFSLGFLSIEYYASNLPDLYLYSLMRIHSLSLCYASLNFWLLVHLSLKLSLTSFWQTIHFTGNHLLTFSFSHCTSISHLHSHSLHSFLAYSDIALIHLHIPQHNSITFKLNTVLKLHSITEVKQSCSLGIWPVPTHFSLDSDCSRL
jgi:hypothetical protein